jgi:hypothetical protein
VCVCVCSRRAQRSEPNGNLVLHLVLLVMSAYKQYVQLNTIYKYSSRSIATPSSDIVVPELSEKWQLASSCEAPECAPAESCNENNFAISPVCGSAFVDTASESSYYDAHEHDPSQALPETTAAADDDELDTAMAALHVTTASPIAASATAGATAAAAATPARSPSSSPCITVKKRGKKQRFIESSDSDSNDSNDENNFSHVDTPPQLNSSQQSSSSAKQSSSFTQRSLRKTTDAENDCNDDDHDVSSDVVDLTEAAAAGFSSGSECSFEDIERTRLDISISDDSDSESSSNKRSSKHSKSPYIKGECCCEALNTCVSVCL